MTPEHLIACAQLSQWYKFGLTEGNYVHTATANVKVSEVGSTSTILSAPTLLDLLNDDDVAPQDVDREALEKALFDVADPYDLDETARIDAAISASAPVVLRSTTHWAVAEYIRLDSAVLAKLIIPEKTDVPTAQQAGTSQATTPVDNEDWDVDD